MFNVNIQTQVDLRDIEKLVLNVRVQFDIRVVKTTVDRKLFI